MLALASKLQEKKVEVDIDHDKSTYQQNSSVGYCHPLVLLEAEEVPKTTTSGKMPQSLRQAAWIARRTVMVGCNRAIISSIIATILFMIGFTCQVS